MRGRGAVLSAESEAARGAFSRLRNDPIDPNPRFPHTVSGTRIGFRGATAGQHHPPPRTARGGTTGLSLPPKTRHPKNTNLDRASTRSQRREEVDTGMLTQELAAAATIGGGRHVGLNHSTRLRGP